MSQSGSMNPSPLGSPSCWRLLPILIPILVSLSALSTPSRAQDLVSGSPTITVNVLNERHPINPYVYGGNFPKDSTFLHTTGTRISRWGGNIATSYNWKLHLQNNAADWFFENFNGSDNIAWVNWVQGAGSAAIIGIPMVDWTPRDASSNSYSVKKYGPQQKTDQWRPDAGNGVRTDGTPILTNDPHDAYIPLLDRPATGDPPGSIYRSEWIAQLTRAFGAHPHLYEFDNEPEIWNGTHRDIHPAPVNYAEMRDKYLRMARLIKSIDPKASVAGPTVCAWWFYWNSAAGGSDKAAHGGVDYLPWWLGAIAAADRKSGSRTLDIFDIHAYPDYNNNGTSDEVDGSRIRSPRGLWDPTYRSEGPIGAGNSGTQTQPDPNATTFIPRFRAMVNAIYPGTQFAITEWNSGDDNNMAASLADADTYGVFGREKIDLATRFISPQPNTLCSLAIEMYKGFAPLSVEAQTNLNVDLFTSYAALSSDGRSLTLMAINKDPKKSVTAKLNLLGFQPTRMVAYERSGDDTSITTLPSTTAVSSYTFKPYSQTLLVFQGSAATGAINWSIGPDALMMVTGGHAVLNVGMGAAPGSVDIVGIKAPTGITMTARGSHIMTGHRVSINVTAGANPGFYKFTITGKTSTGHTETQSGWIAVGVPGSLPAR